MRTWRRLKFRPLAIFYCLFYGILPWFLYEKECHYKGMSYLEHLIMNLDVIRDWLYGNPTIADIKFEIKINRQ